MAQAFLGSDSASAAWSSWGVLSGHVCFLQIKKHARTSKIGLVVNLEQIMACLHAAAAKLPPCHEEMEVRRHAACFLTSLGYSMCHLRSCMIVTLTLVMCYSNNQ